MRARQGLAIEELKAANLASGISTREKEAQWQVEREEEKKTFYEKARGQVLGAKNLLKSMQVYLLQSKYRAQ